MNNASPPLVAHELANEVLILTPQVDQMRETDVCYSLRDNMTDVANQIDHRRVVIDMQNVSFVSSVGILAFLNLRRAIPNPNEKIVFCNLSQPLMGLFKICKLISENANDPSPFSYVDTLESALAVA
ncbi:STAS domain-containing protein [bacterium]|nr:STAS domain-containing protein [bacterium]